MSWIINKWDQLTRKSTPSKETDLPKSALEEVYVFPLPNVVLIPGIVLPLHIFEERYKLMMEDLFKQRRMLAMSWAHAEGNGAIKPSSICGAGPLSLIDKFPDGRSNVLVEGQTRLQIVELIQETPYIKALARQVPDVPFQNDTEETKLHVSLKKLAQRYVFLSDEFPDEYLRYVNIFQQPHHLADFIGFYFLPTAKEKQTHLEMFSRQQRVEKIIEFLDQQIVNLEKSATISDKATNAVKVWH